MELTEIAMSVERLGRDLRVASKTLSDDEARFLVDAYYQMQGNRIRSNNQIRQMEEEPHEVLGWLSTQADILEKSVRASLDVYSDAHPIGRRIRTVVGVGPVIAAGLIAHIDISRAKTAGAIWKFAGLDPSAEWKKGKKRPYNAGLKTLCWKLGESFVKVSNHDDDFYGSLYKTRKEIELKKNDDGLFSEQAEAKLERFNIGKDTDAYKAYSVGKLPPAHIHARAKRYAVKIFLSHLHEVWYRHEFNESPPAPYVMVHEGHAHKIEPPF
jgi:hypothetical protein|tara:strand:+ start:216 stop:1022 length:807 start_codon:yes stop_codon:yes gene_type:complete